MNTLTSVVSAFCLLSASSEIDIEYLVAAHETAVGQVRSVDVRIDLYDLSLDTVEFSPPRHRAAWRWSMKGPVERQRYELLLGETKNEEGHPINLGDLLEDGRTAKVLMNWRGDHTMKITPHRQGSMKAWYAPQEPVNFGVFPNPRYGFALFGIQSQTNEPRRSVRQFVQESSEVHLAGQADVNGHSTWKVEAIYPGALPESPDKKMRAEIHFDPSVDYLIRKLIVHYPAVNPQDPKSFATWAEWEITKFEAFGDGVYFPTEAEFRLYGEGLFDGQPSGNQRLVASRLSVNRELPEDAMNFRFPEHALVTELPTVNNQYHVYLWGPDDKPLRKIESIEELGPDPSLQPSQRGSQGLVLVLVAGLGVAAAVVFTVLRRRRAA
jgi:hypothetical protein